MSEIASDFITVIVNQPELFSDEDREDLAQRTWSNDIDKLEDEIFEWYATRESISTAAMKNLSGKENDRSDRLPGSGTKAPKIKPEDYKPMLLNAIHRSFNLSTQAVTVPTSSS